MLSLPPSKNRIFGFLVSWHSLSAWRNSWHYLLEMMRHTHRPSIPSYIGLTQAAERVSPAFDYLGLKHSLVHFYKCRHGPPFHFRKKLYSIWDITRKWKEPCESKGLKWVKECQSKQYQDRVVLDYSPEVLSALQEPDFCDWSCNAVSGSMGTSYK